MTSSITRGHYRLPRTLRGLTKLAVLRVRKGTAANEDAVPTREGVSQIVAFAGFLRFVGVVTRGLIGVDGLIAGVRWVLGIFLREILLLGEQLVG